MSVYQFRDCAKARPLSALPGPAPPMGLRLLWEELVSGSSCIHSVVHTEDQCVVMLQRRQGPPEPTRSSRARAAILQRVLLGESQKRIALDLERSPSSIAAACADCLLRMGTHHYTARASVLLVVAAHAAAGMPCSLAQTMDAEVGGTLFWRVSVERPERAVEARLSRAEYQVVRLLVEGHSYADMARMRESSPRTIANQLGSAFRKLGVSGRSSLLAALVRQHVHVSNSDSRPRSVYPMVEEFAVDVRLGVAAR